MDQKNRIPPYLRTELFMIRQGLRIKLPESTDIDLPDILDEILDGEQYHWSILYLDLVEIFDYNIDLRDLHNLILKAPKGYSIKWNQLFYFSEKFGQLIWITLLGSKDENSIKRYEDDQELYETCDFIIKMIDGGFWEIFAEDQQFIQRLVEKYPEAEFINSDYMRYYKP